MMKEGMLQESLEGGKARCRVCSFRCIIPEGGTGHCRTRTNKGGKIYSLIYGTITSEAVDPVEKKPLYHFMPGSLSFSVGSAGCNFRCEHCQNWTISQADIEKVYTSDLTPEDCVATAIAEGCKSVSWTYNEPAIWLEYAHDTARICHEKGLKTVYVTNGYATPEHLEKMKGLLDAYRVDIKSYNDDFYKKVCGARLQPVLDSTKLAKKMNMHVEIINLIIPGLNDSVEELKALSKWAFENTGPDTPLHFTRFYPMYHMDHVEATPVEALERARDIAVKEGMKYVYLGNTRGHKYESTWCPSCSELLKERSGYSTTVRGLTKENRCAKCGEKIPVISGPTGIPP
jgi:pyruvate formate lyase activating enzyme